MFRKARAKLTYANGMSSIAVFLVLGSGAYAATSRSFSDAGGGINGCVPAKGGALLVIKPGKHCPRGTISLVINQKGQPGAAGSQGTSGAPGTKGNQGSPGTDGSTGPTGLPGNTGPAGPTEGFANSAYTPSVGQESLFTNTVRSAEITLSTSGTLYVEGDTVATVDCTGKGLCGSAYALFVDGAPVNGSGRALDANNAPITAGIHAFGVTSHLSAGTHTIALKRDINTGTPVSQSDETPAVGSILLGG
jgi:hypothetical protein